jgi:hypothetical protein
MTQTKEEILRQQAVDLAVAESRLNSAKAAKNSNTMVTLMWIIALVILGPIVLGTCLSCGLFAVAAGG